MCPHDKKFNFNVLLSARKFVDGSYVNNNITGSNCNGDYQIILPTNVPHGRYNVSVRSFQAYAVNENTAVYVFKVYLDNLPMVNGYNGNNQSNNQCFGLFPAVAVTYAPGYVGYDSEYHAGGSLPLTQQVSGISSLQNGMLHVRITNQDDTVITVPGATLTGGNWHLVLDFEYLGD